MPRLDISIDAIYGAPNLTDNLTNKVICNIHLLEGITGLDNEHICYGEIILPYSINQLQSNRTIYAFMDYTPIAKQLCIRIRIDNGLSEPEYYYNPINNRQWFPVIEDIGDCNRKILLSQFREINPNGYFSLYIKDGNIAIYSGEETDFTIKAALKQNEIFLLKAFAGNLYQFPTTGVGLIDFLHGNFENTGLANKLQQEFENDRMIINNAYMDSHSGELYLEVFEKDG